MGLTFRCQSRGSQLSEEHIPRAVAEDEAPAVGLLRDELETIQRDAEEAGGWRVCDQSADEWRQEDAYGRSWGGYW